MWVIVRCAGNIRELHVNDQDGTGFDHLIYCNTIIFFIYCDGLILGSIHMHREGELQSPLTFVVV